jgi:DNA polymerase III epsilon subunit-like protein
VGTARRELVVDCETNGLDWVRHEAVEVAWHCLETGERRSFMPPQDWDEIVANAEPKALEINGYMERLYGKSTQNVQQEIQLLAEALTDSTVVACNTRFDGNMFGKMFAVNGFKLPEMWHYRMLDVESYAKGILNLDYVPGLNDICRLLSISLGDHTALGDVSVTVACYQELKKLRASFAG